MDKINPVRATLVQLRTFEAVARLGGVGKAAASLHMAQSTVSTQLRELTSAVRASLFVPRGRGLQLTQEGALLLTTSRDLFGRWHQFEEQVAEMQGLRRGNLRIAAVTTAEYFIPDLVAPFAHAYPGITIELAVENRDSVVRRLTQGDDELAVMMLPPDDLDLDRWPFLENPLVVIAPRRHPLAQRSRLRIQDILREPRLTRELGSGTRRATDQYLEQRGISWPPRMALGSNEAIKHAVAAGLGLAVLSRHALGTDPKRAGLVELPVAGFPIRRMWQLVWRRDRPLSRLAQAFLDNLRQRLAQPPAGKA
jgi:DNA-binding transcriptional LysR family regulator